MPHPDVELKTPEQQRFDDLFPQGNQEPSMETSIPGGAHQDEEAHNTAHPSAAVLMALSASKMPMTRPGRLTAPATLWTTWMQASVGWFTHLLD